MIKIYNTLSRSIEELNPLDTKKMQITMYSCGPTVYDYQHVGHMRRYVGDDILIRILKYHGYQVTHVMNITDVGHLSSDSDNGEDKMEKGSKKFKMSVWDVAKYFEQQFRDSSKLLNIQLPEKIMHATEYIVDQIALIRKLEEKGFTYLTSDGIYFDSSKFPDYFKLSRQNPAELKSGHRVEFSSEKKNISDFALWKFSPENETRQMEWISPWGIGFPGWHIECSAMAMRAFGSSLDIHTGGIDHIPIHHTNEIAQSEAATNKRFVQYWVHHNFLVVNNQKMSKSLENYITVDDIIKKNYDPMALRYLYLQTHYRQEMNFTWGALDAAQNSLDKLRSHINPMGTGVANYMWVKRFIDGLADDLNTSKGLAVLWDLIKSSLPDNEKNATIHEFDTILGLQLFVEKANTVPESIQILIRSREKLRKKGDYSAADKVRNKLTDLGYDIRDTKEKSEVTLKRKHE